MSKVIITADEVKKIASLANLTLQKDEESLFATQFTQTLEVVRQLDQIDTSSVSGTYQVNNLSNVTRDDVVDVSRVLPQDIATREAKKSHNGFFVVERIIDND